MLSRWLGYLRSNPKASDVAIVLVSVVFSFPGVIVSADTAPVPSPHWRGYLVTGVACAALLGVRRHPHVIRAATVACAAALAGLGYTLSPLLLAPTMIALAFVALRAGQKHALAWVSSAIAILLTTMLIARRPGSPLTWELIGTVAWLLLAVALGRAAQLRTAYIEAADARAEYAERTREEEALRLVAGERMRIARELHDVIAHHLALANAQAGTMAYLMDADPARARTMAADLNGTIVAALEDLGATVGLLRQSGEAESPLEPTPGLAQLPDLAASFKTAGLAVSITTDGEPAQLPPGTDLTAYRIIQEALTNVTKHSTADSTRVRIAYTGDRLSITITDDGDTTPRSPTAAIPGTGSGYGLIGMRERAQSLGGRLSTGPRPAGGFEVVADLPLHPHRLDTERSR